MPKQYGSVDQYERKLERVIERLGATDLNYNFDRHGCWVQFRLKGDMYRFDHSKEKATARGIRLTYGSDAFAQVVLSLEDLARMAERGIYEPQTWLAGLKFLPPPVEIPFFFREMGFTEIPSGIEEVKERFRTLAKERHPDAGGSSESFQRLKKASEEAVQYFDGVGRKLP